MDGAATIRSLYLHVPFCERRCEYCDFVSQPGLAGEEAYMDALEREVAELARRLPGLTLDTVFIGGGTPSYVDPGRLAAVLRRVREGFELAADAEVTMEANPSSIDEERAARWLAAGVNRISIGIQSLAPEVLRFLGRVHDRERALAAVGDVRRAGFTRVSCDLIYAVPGLTDDLWKETLDRVLELEPGHLSAYELTVEAGTPLAARVRRGAVRPVDADAALRQHWITVARAARAGLEQYEVSNFARPGESCRHNLVYWRRGHYLAAGVGAHGHVPATAAPALGLDPPAGAVSVRYWHSRRTRDHVVAVGRDGLGIDGSEAVDASDAAAESVMLGLRLSEGVTPPEGTGRAVGRLRALGLVAPVGGGRIRATRRGQEVLDEVIRRLLDERSEAVAPVG